MVPKIEIIIISNRFKSTNKLRIKYKTKTAYIPKNLKQKRGLCPSTFNLQIQQK